MTGTYPDHFYRGLSYLLVGSVKLLTEQSGPEDAKQIPVSKGGRKELEEKRERRALIYPLTRAENSIPGFLFFCPLAQGYMYILGTLLSPAFLFFLFFLSSAAVE